MTVGSTCHAASRAYLPVRGRYPRCRVRKALAGLIDFRLQGLQQKLAVCVAQLAPAGNLPVRLAASPQP